jgi:ATP/maltotriose-dependent transcriptional regulator MalT
MKRTPYLILVLFGFLFSCDESKNVRKILDEVEHLVEQSPDSALILLDSILCPQELKRKQYARYLLLLVEAKDKAYKDISTDTLIFLSGNYFQNSDDWNRRAKAEFYCGRVYHSQKEYDKATTAYLEAERISQKTDDNNLKGLIQYFAGKLYYDQWQYFDAIPKFKRAQEYFSQSPDNYRREIWTWNIIGNSFLIKEMKDSVLVYFNKALNLAKVYNDSNQTAQAQHNIGVFLWKTGDLYSAKTHLQSALSLNGDKESEAMIRLNLARIYSELNQRDSVEYHIRLTLDSLKKSENFSTLSNVYRILSSMEEKTGNYKNALQYQREYSRQLSNLFTENNKHNLQETEKRYNFELLQNEKNRLWIERQGAIIILLLLLCIGGTFFFQFYRKAANSRAIRLEKEIALSKAQQKIYELEELVNSRGDEESQLRHLAVKYLDIYKKGCATEREMSASKQLSGKDFIQKMNKILYGHPDHDWDKLYQILNACYKGFFSQLKRQYPQLTESEFKICCLTYAGFDNTEIALILELSKNTIQHRKSEIRQKLNMKERSDIKSFFNMHVDEKNSM